jgi:hypothetical protein
MIPETRGFRDHRFCDPRQTAARIDLYSVISLFCHL